MVMLMTERLVTVMMGMEMMLSDLPSGPPRSTGAPLVSLFLQRTTLFVCSTTRVTNSALYSSVHRHTILYGNTE